MGRSTPSRTARARRRLTGRKLIEGRGVQISGATPQATAAAGLTGALTTVATWAWSRFTGKPLPGLVKILLGALAAFLGSYTASDPRRTS